MDAIRAIKLYVAAVADAVIAGKAATGEVVTANEFVEVTEPETDPVPTAEAAPAEEAAGEPAAEAETAAGDDAEAPAS